MAETKTIPTHILADTSDENIKRVMDRNGDWTQYYFVKENTYVKAVTHITSLGFNKGPRFHEYLLGMTPDEARKRLKEAGERGTRVHKAIADIIAGVRLNIDTKYPNELTGRQEPFTDDEWHLLGCFMRWVDKYKPETIAQERTVGDQSVGFAGTLDWVGFITIPMGDRLIDKKYHGKRIKVLLDWKTSVAIYGDYKAQVSSYEFGFIGHDKFEKEEMHTGIVRFGSKHKDGYEFQIWNNRETFANFQLFLSAKTIADSIEPDYIPEIEQMPYEYFAKIPMAKAPVIEEIEKKVVKKPRKKKDEKAKKRGSR